MEKLPTINIHGNEYVMVKDRIQAFNKDYPDGYIVTERLNFNGEVCFKAIVCPDHKNPSRTFTGHSTAYDDSKGIAGQAPVEVAETSAVGRALAMMGIGINESVASADEIVKSTHKEAPQKVSALCAHGEPAVTRKTKKAGVNLNREFYTCGRPQKEQCQFFVWVDEYHAPETIGNDLPTITPDEHQNLSYADKMKMRTLAKEARKKSVDEYNEDEINAKLQAIADENR